MTNYIVRQDNLVPFSAIVTTTVLLVVFVLSHVLRYTFPYEPVDPQEKMEIRELIALKFAPEPEESDRRAFFESSKTASSAPARIREVEKEMSKPVEQSPKFATLVQGLDIGKLIPDQRPTQRRPVRRSTSQTSALKVDVSAPERDFQVKDMNSTYAGIRPAESGRSRGASAGGQNASVNVGSRSSTLAVDSSIRGTALSGLASARTSRSSGVGSGGPAISMPSGQAGEESQLDLIALIEWMKKNPGAIPGLVQFEMGHQRGDLSSAVTFLAGDRRFRLFLSCNEVEMLLRICLIEKNTFTLLKDNGIKEESNYLTIGKVDWINERIQSLITTRKAPRGQASAFYSIFWSWWLKEQSR